MESSAKPLPKPRSVEVRRGEGRKDDVVGKPFANFEEFKQGQGTYKFTKKGAEFVPDKPVVAVEQLKNDLAQKMAPAPNEYVQQVKTLNAQLRDLRLQREAANTWKARFFSGARQRLADFDAAIGTMMHRRDEAERAMQKNAGAPLAPEAESRAFNGAPSIPVLTQALTEIAQESSRLPGRFDSSEVDLREQRKRLMDQEKAVRFWQFGRKRELAEQIGVIDGRLREVAEAKSAEINAKRKEKSDLQTL